jgi:hypothetical protein
LPTIHLIVQGPEKSSQERPPSTLMTCITTKAAHSHEYGNVHARRLHRLDACLVGDAKQKGNKTRETRLFSLNREIMLHKAGPT